jgi:hypothetical protein
VLFEVFFTFFEGGEVKDGETGEVIKPRYQFDAGTYHLKAYKPLDADKVKAAKLRAAGEHSGAAAPRRPAPLRAGAREVGEPAPSREAPPDAPPQTGAGPGAPNP